MKKFKNGTKLVYRTAEPIKKPMAYKHKRTLAKCISPHSVLGKLMQDKEIPKIHYQTIYWYDTLRNFSLGDGPKIPNCILGGRPKIHSKYVYKFVTDAELQRADKITKLWRDSVFILQKYKCKEMLDVLLMMETVANDHPLFAPSNIRNLRKGLRALTQYYGALQAA